MCCLSDLAPAFCRGRHYLYIYFLCFSFSFQSSFRHVTVTKIIQNAHSPNGNPLYNHITMFTSQKLTVIYHLNLQTLQKVHQLHLVFILDQDNTLHLVVTSLLVWEVPQCFFVFHNLEEDWPIIL